MRPIARALLALAPLSAWGGADLDWRWSNPQPSGENLIRVDFRDPGRGLIIADNGAVSESMDGGATWRDRGGRLGDDYLIAAAAADARTLLAVSGYGRIWRTVDGGVTWTAAAAYPNLLVAIEACGDGIALAVGDDGIIVRSGDGGATWTQVGSDTSGVYLLGVQCAGRRAFAVGEAGMVLRSEDGGWHWDTLPAPISQYLTGVAFSDSAHGFVTTERGRLAETRDGGRTWSVRPLDTAAYLGGIRRSGADWRITGSDGGIWTSRDDGASWIRSPSLTPAEVVSSDFAGDRGGIAVGANGLILREKGRGGPWEIVRKGPIRYVNGLARVSSRSWLAYGSPGLLLRSDDGADTWQEQGLQPDTVRFWNGAFRLQAGLLAGENGTILRSGDGGRTWKRAATPRDDVRLYGLAWSGPSTAIAAGESGAVWITADTGRTWSQAGLPAGLEGLAFGAVAFPAAGNGWLVGDEGIILRSADRGETWARVPSPAGQNLYGLSFRDPSAGLAVGDGGVALVTRDGGATWSRGSLGTGIQYGFQSAWLGGDTTLAVGSRGHGWFMSLSTDAGRTWSPLPQPTRKELWSVAPYGPGRAILTGQDGAILVGAFPGTRSDGPGPGLSDASIGAFSVRRLPASGGVRFRVELASDQALVLRAFTLGGRGLGTVFRGPLGAGPHDLILPYGWRGPAVFRLEASGPGGRARLSRLLNE